MRTLPWPRLRGGLIRRTAHRGRSAKRLANRKVSFLSLNCLFSPEGGQGFPGQAEAGRQPQPVHLQLPIPLAPRGDRLQDCSGKISAGFVKLNSLLFSGAGEEAVVPHGLGNLQLLVPVHPGQLPVRLRDQLSEPVEVRLPVHLLTPSWSNYRAFAHIC